VRERTHIVETPTRRRYQHAFSTYVLRESRKRFVWLMVENTKGNTLHSVTVGEHPSITHQNCKLQKPMRFYPPCQPVRLFKCTMSNIRSLYPHASTLQRRRDNNTKAMQTVIAICCEYCLLLTLHSYLWIDSLFTLCFLHCTYLELGIN
jgi:hypothetical protein